MQNLDSFGFSLSFFVTLSLGEKAIFGSYLSLAVKRLN